MSEDDKKNERSGSATHKPWERPGQVSQNPDQKAPEKKDIGFEQASKTS